MEVKEKDRLMAPKIRRPAAASPAAKGRAGRADPRRGVLRRPRGRSEDRGDRSPEVIYSDEKYDKGDLVPLGAVPLEKWKKGELVVIPAAQYHGKQISVSGRFHGLVFKEGEKLLHLIIGGCTDEILLKHATRMTDRTLVVHLCRDGCNGGPDVPMEVHGKEGYRVRREEERDLTWETNIDTSMPVVDELEALRARQEEARVREKAAEGEKNKGKKRGAEDESSSGKKKKKRKKKKEKKKEVKSSTEEGEEKGEKKKSPARIGSKAAAQKSLRAVFAKTGLDPNPKVRKKIAGRVKKRMRRGRTKSTSSSSSDGGSSSTVSSLDRLDILEDVSRIKQIARRGPGLLCSSAIEHMKESMMDLGVAMHERCRQ